MQLRTVGIVGAGTMGGGIAISLAQHGFEVLLMDAKPGSAAAAIERARTFWARAVDKGRMGASDAEAAAGRSAACADMSDLAPADLLIEAVFEDLALKSRVLNQLSAIVRDDALIATNTSCLRVGDLAAHVARPERFLGLHYFSPAEINPVVEVVQGPATAATVVEVASAFTIAHGKRPIRCADSYGFAINRFFCPYTNEAVRALDDGLADEATIDAVARETLGAAAGPFQVMNIIKPRINLHAIRNLAPLGDFYAPARSMIALGEADAAWTLGEPQPVDEAVRGMIADRLRAGCFLPVLQAIDEGVAEPAAFDQGALEALRLAHPPCALMDRLGHSEVLRIVRPALEHHRMERPQALERVGQLLG